MAKHRRCTLATMRSHIGKKWAGESSNKLISSVFRVQTALFYSAVSFIIPLRPVNAKQKTGFPAVPYIVYESGQSTGSSRTDDVPLSARLSNPTGLFQRTYILSKAMALFGIDFILASKIFGARRIMVVHEFFQSDLLEHKLLVRGGLQPCVEL
jgi:hypothetical protein